MNRTFGSTCMIAGTAIGAGMIALPMTLAKLGLISTLGLMALTWLIVYYSALLGTELILRINDNLTLSDLSRRLSGRGAELIAMGSVMILSYALLAAYLYGGSSISNTLMITTLERDIPVSSILKGATLFMFIVLALGIRWIDYINRLMFFALIGLLIATLFGLSPGIQLSTIPHMTDLTFQAPTWTMVIPILFTSFGFQMSIPAISRYLNRDAQKIKRSFFWGSVTPVAVYLAWTLTTLGTLTTNDTGMFNRIIHENIDVGEFVRMLSEATTWKHLQPLVWGVSFFAIITSAFGVALGLIDIWQKLLRNRILSAAVTIIPPFIVALFIPGAFIKALGFAGMILAVIALVLPTYLIYKSDSLSTSSTYSIIQNRFIRLLALLFAIGLIGCEVFAMTK